MLRLCEAILMVGGCLKGFSATEFGYRALSAVSDVYLMEQVDR
jgi:hypothetical protein